MIRSKLSPTLAIAFLLLAWAPCPASDRPNVLLIVADDLRNDLGCYGSVAITPHLDALAKQGRRFDAAYCQQAVCNPSRSSFLTGLRPDTLGLWVNGTHFREKKPDVITLPQHFKAKGYHTRGIGKIFHNWHTQPKGDRQSWSADEFLHYANHGDDIPLVKGELPDNHALTYGRMYGKTPLCERRDVPDEAYFDGRVAREAVKTLGEVKDQPFFLAVGFWKPHAPFNAPKKYWDQYAGKTLPPLNPARPRNATDWAFHDSREILGPPEKQITLSAEQIAEMRLGYFANITYMDAQIGKVLQALETHNLRKKTIVIFIADHGYHLGEHTLWAKTSCFEYDAQVPMIVAGPEVKMPGVPTSGLVELVDLFPTLCTLCKLDPPAALDGTSFDGLLRDPQTPGKSAAFTQHPRPAYPDRTPLGRPDVMGYSVRTSQARYTEWREWLTGKVLGTEFYEHPADREELNNKAMERKDSPEFREAQKGLHAAFPPEVPPAKR